MPIGYVATTNFAFTLDSLATASARESDAIDNTTNKYDDYMIKLSLFPIASGTLASDLCAYVYLAGAADGTSFSEPATGVDSAITVSTANGLKFAKVIPMVANSGTTPSYESCIPSVAIAFGGNIPKKFSVVVYNATNAAFGTFPATNTYAMWTGVIYTT